MIRLPAWFVYSMAVLLVLSPALSAVLTFYRYYNQALALSALISYLIVGIFSAVYSKSRRAPLWLALINLALAIALPQLVNQSLDVSFAGTPATWYVTGVATLMAIIAVRQHKVIAWIGTTLLALQVILWGGVEFIFNSGLAGAIALVAAAHAISLGLEKSSREASKYLELAKQTESASAAQSAMWLERSERLTKTLRGALPMLLEIQSGELSSERKLEAKLLEAELRDEIRGRQLVNQQLKHAIRNARKRGVEVVLLDEGGLETIPEESRELIRNRIASNLDQITQGRVTIRSPRQSIDRATFVATRSGEPKPDMFLRF